MEAATKIIIFAGKSQSGKSSSVDYLLSQYPDVCKRFSFAESLKRFCINVFGVEARKVQGTNEQKNELTHITWSDLPLTKVEIDALKIDLDAKHKYVKCKKDYMTGRELLQVFGSNICRKMFADCWVYDTIRRISATKVPVALIDDARFPNEILAFNLNSPQLVKYRLHIESPPYVIKLTRNPINSRHVSETALDHFNFIGELGNRAFVIKNDHLNVDSKNDRVHDIYKSIMGITDGV